MNNKKNEIKNNNTVNKAVKLFEEENSIEKSNSTEESNGNPYKKLKAPELSNDGIMGLYY